MPKDLLLNGGYYKAFIKSLIITKSYLPLESNQGSSARNHPNIYVKNIVES
jgi:hypothetical protein